MDVWTQILSLANSNRWYSSQFLSSVLRWKKPSTLFVIQHSETPQRLVTVLEERIEDIVIDNVCLAHVRILASSFMLKAFMQSIQQLDTHAEYFQTEATVLNQLSSTIWVRLTGTRAMNLARAEQYQQNVTAIEGVIEIIHQFFGMHMETIADIYSALENERQDNLARAIVASSRQASSFLSAVSEGTKSADLQSRISKVVCSSIGVAPRGDVSDQMHVAGQLGQFWNQNGAGASTKQPLGSHDVRLILQTLQKELVDLASINQRMRRSTERNFSIPWEFQRFPIRYAGLSAVAGASSRAIITRSRYLGGSGQLEDQIQFYSIGLSNFVQQHVFEPITGFYSQIFREMPSSASEESLVLSRASLKDMVMDFTREHLVNVPGAQELASEGSLKAIMDMFKEQVKNPLRNTIGGSLGQIAILQVQKLKCDVEELMLKSKQMLRAQELNLALVALVPSILTLTAFAYITSTFSLHWRSRGSELQISTAQTARFLLGSIHTSITAIESERQTGRDGIESVMRYIRQLGMLHIKTCELEDFVERGMIRAPAQVLEQFVRDVKVLQSADVSYELRRRHIERILFSYPFLQAT